MINPYFMQTISHVAIAIGGIFGVFGVFGSYYYGKQVDKLKETVVPTEIQNNIKIEHQMNSPIMGSVQNQTINYFQSDSKSGELNSRSNGETKNKTEQESHKESAPKVIAPNALIYTNNQKGNNTVNNYLDLPKPQISTNIISTDVFVGEYQGVKNVYLTEILLKIDSKIPIPEFTFQMQGSNIINVRTFEFDKTTRQEKIPTLEFSGTGANFYNNTIQNALGIYKIRMYTNGPQPKTIIAWDYDKFTRISQ